MVEPLRHRQTKEAATDMFSLQPPRHISTLPAAEVSEVAPYFRFLGRTGRSRLLLLSTQMTRCCHRQSKLSALRDASLLEHFAGGRHQCLWDGEAELSSGRTASASPRVLSSRRRALRLLLPARGIGRLFVPRDIGGQILDGWLPMSDRCLRQCGPNGPSGACSEGDYRDADVSRTHDTLPFFPPSTRR
jgi:hypothetical protein